MNNIRIPLVCFPKKGILVFTLLISSYLTYGQGLSISKGDANCANNVSDGWARIDTPLPSDATINWYKGAQPTGWSIGSGSAIYNLTPGFYTAEVTVFEECIYTKTIEIKITGTILVEIKNGYQVIEYCSDDDPDVVELVAVASGGKEPYVYSWNGGKLPVSVTGQYIVKVTDQNECVGAAGTFMLFIPIDCSKDPNDIIGPEGWGAEKWVSVNDQLSYTIRFENDLEFATAAARYVKILFPVEPNLDLLSFRLGDFGFGNLSFSVPPNSAYYSQRLDATDSLGVYVDVIAGVDVTQNNAFWILQAIDPATGLPPTDPDLGVLPVNDTVTHRGEGYVEFTITPLSNLQTGDSVRAYGHITFDINEPIFTNTWQNMIDAVPPESDLMVLPVSSQNYFEVSFTGQDDLGGTGIGNYELYFEENNGPVTYYGTYPEGQVANFLGNYNSVYSLFSRAIDHTGNTEPMKTQPDATVIIDSTGLYNYVIMNLPAGWSGISSYVNPDDPSVVSMFQPVVSNMVILMDQVNIYWPAMGVNSIINWNTHNGYIIKMNTASQLILGGLVETDREIHLNAGWNLIPVLSPDNVSTVDLFNPIGDTLTIVKEVAGNRIYWPSMGINMLPALEPGKSYQVSVKNPTSITYPMSLHLVPVKPYSLLNETPWNDPIRTGQTHSFAIYKKVLKKLEKGDFIGAFNHEGLCAGITKVEDAKNNLALTVFGDDPFTRSFQDGMNTGEEITFKLFRPTSQGEFQLTVIYEQAMPDHGRFNVNGLSAIADIILSPVAAPETISTNLIALYPNPVSDILTVNLNIPEVVNASMKIIDMQGNVIIEVPVNKPVNEFDLSDWDTGVYLIRIVNDQTIWIKKLVVLD